MRKFLLQERRKPKDGNNSHNDLQNFQQVMQRKFIIVNNFVKKNKETIILKSMYKFTSGSQK